MSLKSAERSTTRVAGARVKRSAITFWVVACGRAQNTRSRFCAAQSMPSSATSFGNRIGRELRKHLPHLLPGPPVGGEQNDLGPRMAQQQAHQFRTGVAGRAKDADPGLGKW